MAEDEGLSLLDYARKLRMAGCAVCALPDEIRHQMATASDKKIKRSVVMAWLRDAHKIKVDDAAITAHSAGHHDAKDF